MCVDEDNGTKKFAKTQENVLHYFLIRNKKFTITKSKSTMTWKSIFLVQFYFFFLRFFVNDKNPTEFYLFVCKTFSLDRKFFFIHGKMIKNTPQLTKYFLALADSTDGGKNGEPKKYCFMLFSAQIFFSYNFFPASCPDDDVVVR